MASSMRGLTQASTRWSRGGRNLYLDNFQFIADIRACRVKELEEKRINKEMANIRKQFKGPWGNDVDLTRPERRLDPQLSSYQRKKYVAKLVFAYILGYKVDVGHFEAANLVTSNKYTEKQIVRPLLGYFHHMSRLAQQLGCNSLGIFSYDTDATRTLRIAAHGRQFHQEGPWRKQWIQQLSSSACNC